MAKTIDLRHGKGFGFWGHRDGAKDWTVYLMRCFKCGRENYGPAVSSGACAWCPYDANADQDLTPPK